MADLHALTAKTALNKMLRDKHFSICTIRQIAEMFEIIPDRQAMAILQPLHCVNYEDMPRELYRALPDLIQQALSGTPVFQFDIHTEHRAGALTAAGVIGTAKPGLLKRLFHHK